MGDKLITLPDLPDIDTAQTHMALMKTDNTIRLGA